MSKKPKRKRSKKNETERSLNMGSEIALSKSTQGLIDIYGKPLRKSVKTLAPKENATLCIYAPMTWPFIFKKFMKNFLNVIHPKRMVMLRELGITDYFWNLQEEFPICKNRNYAFLKAMKYKADYILCLDADMSHPPDIAYRLAKHNLPIVSGVYHHQAPPHLPVIYKHKEGDVYQHYWNYPRDEVFDVDLVGMGCLWVDTRAVSEITLPYFKYGSGREDGITDITEDVLFCRKLIGAGYTIMVDPTIKCTHYNMGEVSEPMYDIYIQKYHDYRSLIEKFGDPKPDDILPAL
jgi:hypothetical protein